MTRKRQTKSRACQDEHEAKLRRHAKKCVHHWIGVANSTLITGTPIPIPAVRFDLKGRTAGMWVTQRGRDRGLPTLIRINADLLLKYPKEMIQETVPHEVAHAVTDHIWTGRASAHGKEWKSVMRAFGKEPTRCHEMETKPARRTRVYRYRCKCERPWMLSSARHKRASQSTRFRYSCPRCKETLQYTGEPPVWKGGDQDK